MGRQAIGVKICSCPRRDKDKEEGDAKANGGQQYPGSSKRKISKNDLGQTKKIKSENPATPQVRATLKNIKILNAEGFLPQSKVS